MALKDYNGIAFKNSAIDRMNKSFGKGPGDGQKKSTSTTSSTSGNSGLLINPWSKPKPQAVTAPTIKKPASTLMPAAKPSTNVSTVADNSNKTAAPAAPKTMKTVRAENRVKKAEAKGTAAVSRINKRANMTEEEKAAKRESRGSTLKKVGTGIASAVGTTLGLLNEVEDYKAKKASNKPG